MRARLVSFFLALPLLACGGQVDVNHGAGGSGAGSDASTTSTTSTGSTGSTSDIAAVVASASSGGPISGPAMMLYGDLPPGTTEAPQLQGSHMVPDPSTMLIVYGDAQCGMTDVAWYQPCTAYAIFINLTKDLQKVGSYPIGTPGLDVYSGSTFNDAGGACSGGASAFDSGTIDIDAIDDTHVSFRFPEVIGAMQVDAKRCPTMK